ncbi:hypothetical protein [Mycobacteroides immunogenum]|uniref:Uncharacterized protein n=1 Tax=Mycobacteroides immunogenum TaxID=83262 RepID=A0A7V8LR93_9MYCO|nr:hypothetical protein [Mycobacteroides immunogenum]AMT70494.1 hypothetical protein ABG82_09300 [Mycobacteroides immunogenum]ANO03566.1 hypothetical protein BAB75_09360 [Mycobacteroides immunogenum]KIU41975.1 hypothetical protein TL11_02285 [Mycobacteroides immunogenum]KPG13582.1 hypothetical protein AN909_04630 [Mycobacteroides immunogenum]KPG14497.1 hypothetical protein AN908_08235 [Mycobacteroides immunogenum]
MASTLKTADLLALLRRHYIKPGQPLPGGVFLHEVGGNGTWGASARADAIYIGFTSSSGRILVGHELKVSRSDWLNELNKPGKADQWADQCHTWWLVVSDLSIVQDGELPPGWGLMSPGRSKTRMAIHTPAAVKSDHTPSWDAMRSLMARYDTLRAQEIRESLTQRSKQMDDDREARIAQEVQRRMREAPESGQAAERLKLIEEAIGARISWSDYDWTPRNHVNLELLGRIGKAALTLGGLQDAVLRIANRHNSTESVRRHLDEYDAKLAEFVAVAKSEMTDQEAS